MFAGSFISSSPTMFGKACSLAASTRKVKTVAAGFVPSQKCIWPVPVPLWSSLFWAPGAAWRSENSSLVGALARTSRLTDEDTDPVSLRCGDGVLDPRPSPRKYVVMSCKVRAFQDGRLQSRNVIVPDLRATQSDIPLRMNEIHIRGCAQY